MTSICPITLEKTTKKYSEKALKRFSPKLKSLKVFPYSAEEQRTEAIHRAATMSIQGVQAKLSAKLKVKEGEFEIVDKGGTYILKPQSNLYVELPENESLTMTMAEKLGIDVPFHGLIYAADNTFTYFVKRFDRYAKNKKYALEDFAQLSGKSRDTKYDSSYEKVISVIDKYCSFPVLEKKKFFNRFLFCFITGNEDMHLKNFSLITRGNKIELSPAYDLLNSTIAMKQAKHEIALPLRGRTKNLSKKLLIEYFGKEQLKLSKTIIYKVLETLDNKKNEFQDLINKSMLSKQMKEKYIKVLKERYRILI
jgi:serine/threonine-protein kinase HipA